MVARIPSAESLGGRGRVSPQRQIVTYRPIVAPGAGEGLAEFGKEVTKKSEAILTEMVGQEQDKQLRQAQIDYSKMKLALINGDGENETGYRNLKGQDALDGFKDYNKKLGEARQEIFGRLTGNVAKTFDMWSQNEEMNARGSMTGHLNDQRVAVTKITNQAFINQMQQELVASATDPNVVAQKRVEIMVATLKMAKAEGIADENAKQQLVRGAWTSAHKEAIARLLADGRPEEAKTYLEKYRGDIDQLQIGAIEKTVNDKSVEVEAQTAADTALTKFKTEEEALAWVRKKYSGARETAAVKEVQGRFSEKDRQDARMRRDAEAAGDKVADTVLADPNLTETQAWAQAAQAAEKLAGPAATKAEIRKQAEQRISSHFAGKARDERDLQKGLLASATEKANAGKLTDLTQAERDAVNAKGSTVMASLERRNEDVLAGRPQFSDKASYEELYRLYRDDKAAFMQLDLYGEKYAGKLNKEDLRRFEGLQLGLDKDKVRSDAKAAKEAERGQRLSRALTLAKPFLKEAGFKVGGKDDNTGEFQRALADRIDALPDDKVPTEKELQEIALGLLIQGENRDQGGFLGMGDKDVRGFEATGQFYSKDFAKENEAAINALSRRAGVEASRTAVIVEALVRAGRPTTAEAIKAADARLKAAGK